MGLFTGTSSSATGRANSAAPLKRRSLGRVNRDSSGSLLGPLSRGTTTTTKPALPVEEGRPKSPEGVEDDQVQTPAALKASSQSGAEETSDEEPDLADLQSDNTFLYQRHLPLDSALGLKPLHPPKVSIFERIDAYIAEHYLDCFGITHQDEEVQHHNRLVPFFAKAPRFLSIRSLKRKELERDYTKERDTTETCARKQLCLDQSFEGYRHIFSRPRPDDTCGVPSAEPLGSSTATETLSEAEAKQRTAEKVPLERRCFNCGQSDHAVAQCPLPRNRQRIRQSRLEFEESKAERAQDTSMGEINGHARLHQQLASAEQRLRWLDEFVPGKPSRALIEALAWEAGETGGDRDAAETKDEEVFDLPYLRNMLIWGYPPGWISDRDPVEQIRQRIQQDSEWETVTVLDGFDLVALAQPQHPESDTVKDDDDDNSGKYADHGKMAGQVRRWVDYQTHLFDSNRLQSFDRAFRAPLPQMREEPVQNYPRSCDSSFQSRSRSTEDTQDWWWCSDRPAKRRR
ncbi:hypothetical protein NDA14_007133 [Ustilago hordei]|nr:hypothetical protein NDA10_005996 [Ustilago hordei]KAJ1585447.1 hypothetical protein NDA15_006276 [Ustilago hordei]KAJ1588355.1 hypothetical protein NDA12_006583 [Ustilago hordei]KAJ1601858.1 hypothetical protein NDA14_007133 [Ustilago hordei]UTT94276.1 hypothetical protein NDA17_000798 [Ustilago hordei]